MRNKQLLYLFLSSFIILFVGMGLFPLLPVYDAQFGATRTVVGIHFALMYASNAAGHMLAGRLSERLTRKGAFIGAGALGIPALILLGQAAALWQVVVLTAVAWFCGGVAFALVGVFIGLHAERSKRGKSFVLTSLAFPLGAAFGGATVGRLVAWQGYPLMFAVLGAVWAFLPLIGLLKLKDEASARPAASVARSGRTSPQFGRAFYVLSSVMLMSATAINVGRLGLPLSMQALDLPASEIASTTAISGLVTVPLALLIGVLSDRVGRRRFLALTYLLVASGALMLSAANEPWHFWLAATLMFVALCTNGALTSALAADMLSQEALSRGLPRITAMSSVAAVLSFAGTGYVMDTLGATILYLAAAGLAVATVLRLRQLQGPTQPVASVVASLNRHHEPAEHSAMPIHAHSRNAERLRRIPSSC